MLTPPISGAAVLSSPLHFSENSGDKFEAWNLQVAANASTRPFIAFRAGFKHRAANMP